MNFLSIDCSTGTGSLFLKIKNKTFNKVLQSDKFENDLLMQLILDFFKENNSDLSDISCIFVNQGPGNFSGLRGSLATAKGIGLSRKINLFGYNTFIWSCSKFFNINKAIYSIIKFREEYYIKKFQKKLKQSSKVRKIEKSEILKKYKNKFKIVPKNIINDFDDEILSLDNLNVVNLDHNDLEFLQLKGLLDKKMIKPIYLS